MEERITLGREAFKALASESRTSLLKALGERRKTPSELSRELGLTVQSVSEHLARLEAAQLVKRAESGRKWVYYELTRDGRALIYPEQSKARVWVVLAISLIALTGVFFIFFQSSLAAPAGGAFSAAPAGAPPAGQPPGLEAGQKVLGPAVAAEARASPTPGALNDTASPTPGVG